MKTENGTRLICFCDDDHCMGNTSEKINPFMLQLQVYSCISLDSEPTSDQDINPMISFEVSIPISNQGSGSLKSKPDPSVFSFLTIHQYYWYMDKMLCCEHSFQVTSQATSQFGESLAQDFLHNKNW